MPNLITRVVSGCCLSVLAWSGAAVAEREGSGTHEQEGSVAGSSEALPTQSSSAQPAGMFQRGQQLELIGQVSGDDVIVTAGPYANQKFELVKDPTWNAMLLEGGSGATFTLTADVMASGPNPRLRVSTFRLVASAPIYLGAPQGASSAPASTTTTSPSTSSPRKRSVAPTPRPQSQPRPREGS